MNAVTLPDSPRTSVEQEDGPITVDEIIKLLDFLAEVQMLLHRARNALYVKHRKKVCSVKDHNGR